MKHLRGVGLLAQWLELFWKLRVFTESGNQGAIKLLAVPNAGLLELLEILKFLHRL